jgi:hypothetical protein
MAILIDTKAQFDEMYKGSYYTIVGCDNVQEYEDAYKQMLRDAGLPEPIRWVSFTGQSMNAIYQLIGEDAYPDDLNFLAFSLNGMGSNGGKLALFRLQNGDSWFDDIVDNNARAQDDDGNSDG